MEEDNVNSADHLVPSNTRKRWWDKQSETMKAAYFAGAIAILIALIEIVPSLNLGKKASNSDSKLKVSIENPENAIENVEGDVNIYQNSHAKADPKSVNLVDPSLEKDQANILPNNIGPKIIMDILYAREDTSDREYAARNYKHKYIGEDGWEAIVTEKSSPSFISGDVIIAQSDNVRLTIFSDRDMRHLAIGDKIKVTGKIGVIVSRNGNALTDTISIQNAGISLIGRGNVKHRTDVENIGFPHSKKGSSLGATKHDVNEKAISKSSTLITQESDFLEERISPKIISEMLLKANGWEEESSVSKAFRGKTIPETGWVGIVATFPKPSGKTHVIEVKDKYSEVNVEVYFEGDPSKILIEDEIIIHGKLLSVYRTTLSSVWISVDASKIARRM